MNISIIGAGGFIGKSWPVVYVIENNKVIATGFSFATTDLYTAVRNVVRVDR